MIKIKELSKKYGSKVVLDNINLVIEEGDFVALTGINGAGKTTLVNIIVGSQQPTTGTVETDLEVNDFGLQIQDVVFNNNLKVSDYIKLQKRLYKLSDEQVEQFIKLVGVDKFKTLKIKKLSGGQKQRLNILLAIIHNPKVLIFDELTTGLDALSRYQIRKLLHRLNDNGTTIILVSHYMDEIEDLCNKVICLKDGKVADYDTIDSLLDKYDVTNLDQYFKQIMIGDDDEY